MSRQQLVLLIESDPVTAGRLSDDLRRHQLRVEVAHSAVEAREFVCAGSGKYDAIVMETDLTDGDGLDLCREFRSLTLQLPIVLLSSAGEVTDIVRGLSAGANDYLVKPYRILSLLARLRAHARSYERSSFALLTVGPIAFNPGKRLVYGAPSGRPERLTPKEARLFEVLYRADQQPVDRDQLLREIWGDQPDLESQAVEAMIWRLRQKIEVRPSRPKMLLKVPHGYRLADPTVFHLSPKPAPRLQGTNSRQAVPTSEKHPQIRGIRR